MSASSPSPSRDGSVGAIWAQARGRVIGADGTIPWHLPEDLRFFKQTTLGSPVIMGRGTWDSLAEPFRPLPGRANIVVSRMLPAAPGARVVRSLEAAFDVARALAVEGQGVDDPGADEPGARPEPVAWVIGGAQLYQQALALIDVAVITEIDLTVTGDAYAPELGDEWTPVSTAASPGAPGEDSWLVSGSGVRYRFTTYERHVPGRGAESAV